MTRRGSNRWAWGAAVALVALGQASTASASLLGVGEGMLYRIDATSRVATEVGSTGIDRLVIGLTVDADGTPYAISSDSMLWILNPATGAATLVGPLGVLLNSGGGGDLTVDPVSDTLFLTDGTALYTVDKESAATTRVGAFGVITTPPGLPSYGSRPGPVSALQFIGPTLYGFLPSFLNIGRPERYVETLVDVDPTTGAASAPRLVTTTPMLSYFLGYASMVFDADSGNTYLIGTAGIACPCLRPPNAMYLLDLATGAATPVGELTGAAGFISAISQAQLAANPPGVPEPATGTLLGLGLLSALRRVRRGAGSAAA